MHWLLPSVSKPSGPSCSKRYSFVSRCAATPESMLYVRAAAQPGRSSMSDEGLPTTPRQTLEGLDRKVVERSAAPSRVPTHVAPPPPPPPPPGSIDRSCCPSPTVQSKRSMRIITGRGWCRSRTRHKSNRGGTGGSLFLWWRRRRRRRRWWWRWRWRLHRTSSPDHSPKLRGGASTERHD